MKGDYDPTNIKPIATKDLISWAYQVSINSITVLKLIEIRLTFDRAKLAVCSAWTRAQVDLAVSYINY